MSRTPEPTDLRMPAGLEALVAPICAAHGVELVDVRLQREPGGTVLRVVVDRERPPGAPLHVGGVSIDDCQAISRDLSTALDVSDLGQRGPLAGRYRLEVSSPGVDRPLVKLRDFERFVGETIVATTRSPVRCGPKLGERRKFKGRLLGVAGPVIRMEQDGVEVALPHAEIVKANLVFDWGRARVRA
jgi:ribosome maturation factor RimP